MNRLFAGAVLAALTTGMQQVSHALPIVYSAELSGAAESPPNASLGFGLATITFDDLAHTMRVEASFSNLLGTTTAAHIHAATASPGSGTAGVATQVPTFAGFPLGVTSGTYDHTFDMTLTSSYNPGFISTVGGTVPSAEGALSSYLAQGRAYFNIHSTVFPGGEIRGFLAAAAVPEPATLALLGIGLAGLGFSRRKRAATS